MEDCGGFAGAADLLKIIEDFEKYGVIGVGEEEVLKVIKHYAELSDLIQHGLRPSPEFATLLQQIRDAQLNGEIHTRDEALALVDRLRSQPETLP